MANEQNLRRLTSDEAREIGRKGGIASGKARRKRKDLKDAAKLLLDLPASEKNKEQLENLGISEDDANNQMVMLAKVMQLALQGDMNAVSYLTSLTTISESEKQRNTIEKQRIKLEKERLEKQSKPVETVEDDKVVIINDLPKNNTVE